ncbi:sodium-dependent transporter [Capnocytophaga ochracea]|uniref:Na(+)/dicarboxylate symporter n=3 Tax=Bacteroidota TaxID=976 RepID=A0A2X2RPY7_CAPOC|nr:MULTISPECIES: DASS family sodium-coupled anion symporter [Capnocytophaga]EJF37051.1 transporter, DASS family [Capnocytophaga sp. oral taxon 335 str. F0486]EKY12624.1 transporter, DASS family [Capnocytophaga sp. oral taxon 324 str. F0483]SQA78683.1 Na(+)/dicarboxylate symporter [Capnocytophaga ochracea]VDG82369.1 sodium-dependent transporter [Capnocytophaga ochracea]
MTNNTDHTPPFDPLDMNNYHIEKLPKVQKTGVERFLQRIGGPLAILAFVLIYWVANISFINRIDTNEKTTPLTESAMARYAQIEKAKTKQLTATMKGEKKLSDEQKVTLQQATHNEFIHINYAMLAIFVAAIILWITEAIPNYLTSLLVILGIVLCGVTTDKTAYAQLGHPVMWLNILSFILASMLVKTQVAKRFALWFVLKFGRNSGGIILSFIIINLVLSAFISATTAKAAILLPIFMVIAAIYGATGGEHRNNFGRNLILQNLFQINLGANAFLTGSGAALLAGSLIAGAMGIGSFSYQDWFKAAFPMSVLLILIAWFVGSKIYFPLKKEERVPQIEGGMERLREELNKLGKMKFEEYKAIAIFVCVLILWATDKQHGINQTAVAFMGAVVALLPGVGVVKWNDVDIPWHLLLFSAGAYTLGAGLDATGLPGTLIDALFGSLGITQATPFWVLYMILTGGILLFSLIFQSKTMLTLIFIPIAIGVAQKNGYPIMSLAFPVAMLVGHVYVLPFNSKPAALLYTTNQYSWSDTFKFGITMMFISWLMILLWGETVLRWYGFTNGVFF